MSHLPIACTLTPDDLRARRDGLLPGLVAQAVAREPLPDGYRWTFETRGETLAAIATVIEAERRCCRFLQFTVTLSSDLGPITVDVTGPPGTAAFLDSLGGSQ